MIRAAFPILFVALAWPARVQMQHEGVGIGAQLRHDERRPMRHQPTDEMNIAAQAVEFGNDNRSLVPLGQIQLVQSRMN